MLDQFPPGHDSPELVYGPPGPEYDAHLAREAARLARARKAAKNYRTASLLHGAAAVIWGCTAFVSALAGCPLVAGILFVAGAISAITCSIYAKLASKQMLY